VKFVTGQTFCVHGVRSECTTVKGETVQGLESEDVTIDELLAVESVDSRGTAKLKLTLENIQTNSRSPGSTLRLPFSTTAERAPTYLAVALRPTEKVAAQLEVLFTVDCSGRVLTVQRNDAEGKKATSMPPGFSDQFKDGTRETLQQLFPHLPQTPLVVGQTWNDTLRLNRHDPDGAQEAQVTYRYAGPTRYNSATLEKITTTAIFDWPGEQTLPGGTAKSAGQENPGVIYFDRDAGRLVERDNCQKRTVDYTEDGKTTRKQITASSKFEVSPAKQDKKEGTGGAQTGRSTPSRDRGKTI